MEDEGPGEGAGKGAQPTARKEDQRVSARALGMPVP